jgi:hypothetical protein
MVRHHCSSLVISHCLLQYKKMGYPERKIKKALNFVLQEAALVLSIIRIIADLVPEGLIHVLQPSISH